MGSFTIDTTFIVSAVVVLATLALGLQRVVSNHNDKAKRTKSQ